MEIKKIVIDAIEDLMDIKVSESSLISSFENLGIDNLDLSELVMILEDKLEFTVDDSIYDTKTADELIKHINKLINK